MRNFKIVIALPFYKRASVIILGYAALPTRILHATKGLLVVKLP
jgi:hypothetical protein